MMKREILCLTGLRGLAAFLVILYHFGQPANGLAGLSRYHVPKGYLAVDAFFMLSGFVMSYTYSKGFLEGVTLNKYSFFLIKRIARIYPAYFGIGLFYLLKIIVNVSADNALGSFTWKDHFANFFMATGWGLNIRPLIGDSWSVSAEIVCYFAFPILVIAVLSFSLRSAILSLLVSGVSYFLVFHSGIGVKGWLDVVASDSPYPLLRAFAGFVAGMVIFQIDQSAHHVMNKLSDLIVGVALALIISSAGLLGSDLGVLVGVFLLVAGLSLDGRLATFIFANPVVMFLGRVSYSLYLVHVMIIPIVLRLMAKVALSNADLSYWLAVVIYVVICLIIATLSYEFFEVRGGRAMLSALLYLDAKARSGSLAFRARR